MTPLSSSDLIIFIGHSLGKTDCDYFIPFFSDVTCKEVHYYFHSENGYDKMNERLYDLCSYHPGQFKINNTFKAIRTDIDFSDLNDLY